MSWPMTDRLLLKCPPVFMQLECTDGLLLSQVCADGPDLLHLLALKGLMARSVTLLGGQSELMLCIGMQNNTDC